MTEQGIVLISVKDGESGDNPYRTGRVAVVKEEAIRNIVHPKELSDTIIQKRVCYIPDEAWKLLGLPMTDIDNRNKEETHANTEADVHS